MAGGGVVVNFVGICDYFQFVYKKKRPPYSVSIPAEETDVQRKPLPPGVLE